MGLRRTITPGDGDPAHGTANGYKNLGCRGPDCREAWAKSQQRLREADPRRRKVERLAKQPTEVHPEPDPNEEPYVFARTPMKRVEMTGTIRLSLGDEDLIPWMTERLEVLRYFPMVTLAVDGDDLLVRCCLSLMPVEAAEKGWADQVVAEAVEWARGDPRLVR